MAKKKRRLKPRKSGGNHSSEPPQTDSLFDRGFANYQAGRPKEAEDYCRAALKTDKHHSDALHLLGMSRHQRGDNLGAIDFIKKAISIAPNNFFYYLNLGNIYFSGKNHSAAESCYKKALALNPNFIPTIIHTAKNLEQSHQQEEALSYYQKALTLEPDNPEILTALGNFQLTAGMTENSITTLRKLVKAAPASAESYYNLGGALMRFGKTEEAAKQFKKTLNLSPEFIAAHCNLGSTYEALGRLKKGMACYRQAISIQPSYCLAHYLLAKIKKHTDKDDDIVAMEKLLTSEKLNTWDKILITHGLGKSYEDIGSYNVAFDFLEKANNLNREFSYKTADDAAYFNHIKKIFNHSLFEQRAHSGTTEKRAIFVLGMPRSGTSLVEQIFASHPNVFGAGELADLENLLSEKNKTPTGNIDFRALIKNTSSSVQKNMGQKYLTLTNRFIKTGGAEYVVDKMPHNFIYIGMIKLILPNAKIIHCKRNPMDNCLSIYKNLLNSNHKYACNQKELGEYYRLYQELMKHWHKLLPGFIYDISYEDLVANQEKQSRAMFEFCKIPWDKQILQFHKTKRTVATLSSSQVRRPIYNDSVKLWEKYGDRLEELANALEIDI